MNINNEHTEKADIISRLFGAAAKHPYLCALAACLLITPFCYGEYKCIPSYTKPVTAAIVSAAVTVIVLTLCRKHKLPAVSAVLFSAGGIAACITAAYYLSFSKHKIEWFFLSGILLAAGAYAVFFRKELKRQFNVMLIMSSSFLLKFCYVLGTDIHRRQHDAGNIGTEGIIGGHLGYISYLLREHHLYNGDYREYFQYCPPPFHHSISAVWVYAVKNVFNVSLDTAFESVQMLTLFYSMAVLISAYYIFRYFGLDGRPLYISLAVTAYHPCFTFLSGLVNNDALAWALVMGAVLSTLKWYRERSLRQIMKISLCIGLGMMTKVSAALAAPPVAVVFLIAFIKNIRTEWKKLIGQFAAFGAVCVPLGMWFPVRGYIKWKIPLDHVQALSDDLLQSLKGMDYFKRITDFSPSQLKRVFENWAYHGENGEVLGMNESNPLIAILKNSIFSEFIGGNDLNGSDILYVCCYVLFWLGVALAAFAFVAMIWTFVRDNKEDRVQKVFLGLFYAVLVGNLYVMSAKYTFVCTMNFRYLMPTVITGSLFTGLAVRKNKTLSIAVSVPAAAFSALSALIYIVTAQNSVI